MAAAMRPYIKNNRSKLQIIHRLRDAALRSIEK
nr:MAG TPA: hypothetical protein [Bacteriophage sp.]DAD60024.1 MAG TPA: hypothetical protein [Bacteriophage sp.]